jgi:hypothetical protein
MVSVIIFKDEPDEQLIKELKDANFQLPAKQKNPFL